MAHQWPESYPCRDVIAHPKLQLRNAAPPETALSEVAAKTGTRLDRRAGSFSAKSLISNVYAGPRSDPRCDNPTEVSALSSKPAISLILGTWFGCGYSPWGPGTAGSLAALLIAIALHTWLGAGRLAFGVLILLLLYPGIWAATHSARILNSEDPGVVVIDEVLGQWLTLLGAAALNWKTFLAAFLLFRLFDIWKPWPIRRLENLPEGIGIVADDLAAGVYGAVVLTISGSLGFY